MNEYLIYLETSRLEPPVAHAMHFDKSCPSGCLPHHKESTPLSFLSFSQIPQYKYIKNAGNFSSNWLRFHNFGRLKRFPMECAEVLVSKKFELIKRKSLISHWNLMYSLKTNSTSRNALIRELKYLREGVYLATFWEQGLTASKNYQI